MGLQSAEAIILQVVDLQERDRIVTFLTPALGTKRGVANGARAKFSRFAGQLQPLAFVAVTWFEKPDRDLVRIRDLQLVTPCKALSRDLEGMLLGSYLAEQAALFVPENEASEVPFRLLRRTLTALEDGVEPDLAARYYEVWTLRLAGVFPAPRECPQCGHALAQDAAALSETGDAIVCSSCNPDEGLRVDEAVIAFLLASAKHDLAGMAALGTADEPVLRRVERLCSSVRRNFLGSELRSYEVRERTLASLPHQPA